MDGDHYILVDGKPWGRYEDVRIAEIVRQGIVDRWAQYYDEIALKLI